MNIVLHLHLLQFILKNDLSLHLNKYNARESGSSRFLLCYPTTTTLVGYTKMCIESDARKMSLKSVHLFKYWCASLMLQWTFPMFLLLNSTASKASTAFASRLPVCLESFVRDTHTHIFHSRLHSILNTIIYYSKHWI